MLPVISWREAIVEDLADLLYLTWPFDWSRQVVVNDSTAVNVRRKTRRSFWSYGAVDKSVIIRRSVTVSQRKFEYEWRTATSRQKKTR